jgi:hypothetical protein
LLAQDSLYLSGVVLYPTSTEGDYVTPEFLLPIPFQNIRVCQDMTNERQVEVSIDINQINPDNVVATWIDYSYEHHAHVAYGSSFNGGQTWTNGLLPTDMGGFITQGDPAIACDKEGNFFISFISLNDTHNGGIYVAKSTDGGMTFPESTIVRLDIDSIFDDKPYIAIDKTDNATQNNIYVAWHHKWESNGNEIHFARSTDNGSTFQRQRINVFARKWQLGAMPAIDANGIVYVVWMGHELNIPYDPVHRNFYLAKSSDGGINFGTETIIFDNVGSFSQFGINLNNRLNPFPIIATNPALSGHLYLTWNNRVAGLGGSNPDSSDVLFMRSTDYGETWFSPINIINNGLDPSPTLNDQFFPWIAVNPTGEIINIMYYNRSNFPDNDSMHINISTSIDNGYTFTPPLRITDVPSFPAIDPPGFNFMGDYNGMAYSPSGLLYPIWADSRHGNWDIFTAPSDIKVVSTSIVSGWQTLSIPVEITDFKKSIVWPKSTADAYSFCGSSGYVIEDILSNGTGYYVKFGSAENVSYAGGLLEQYEIPVCEGWNIVGSITSTVPISTNVCLYPAENKFTSPFYIYSNGYQIVDHITPGRGHWVKVDIDGNLLVNFEPIHCVYPENISEEEMDHFIITDADGKNQDLFVANLSLNPSLAEIDLSMPPPIPEFGFDARFGEGEYIKPVSPDSGTVELVINIETQAYPVSVSWELNPVNGIEYSIITGGMGKESSNERINQTGSTAIQSLTNGKFRLNAQAKGGILKNNLPTAYYLSQNYPNPFNPSTTISYSITKRGLASIKVFDILGKEVAILINDIKDAGTYSVSFNASKLPSGIYFYTLTSEDFIATKKLILLK